MHLFKVLHDLSPDGAPLILAGADLVQKRGDQAFPFVQESNFLYLTGIDEPGWQLIADVAQNNVYFVRPKRDETYVVFNGDADAAMLTRLNEYGTIIEHGEADELILSLARTHDSVYGLGVDPHAEHYEFPVHPALVAMEARLAAMFKRVTACRPALAKMRAIKSAEEIETMRSAITVSIEGFRELKGALTHAQHEYELEAFLNAAFRRSGAQGHAYDPIVAAGKNACTLHYGKNNDALPKNGLVLIDAGASYGGYAADITRTYAVGTPSAREVAVHAAVEKAHHEIIALIKPGVSVKEYHDSVDEIMKAALSGLGLLNSPDDYRKYFPHAISHGLGIDVHDSLGAPKEFAPGMVLTVEPGIYIPEEGIGVRIEDDILVTETGNENLSASLPTSL